MTGTDAAVRDPNSAPVRPLQWTPIVRRITPDSPSDCIENQRSVRLTKGVSLVGNLAYASGDLRVGLPLVGGVKVGAARTMCRSRSVG